MRWRLWLRFLVRDAFQQQLLLAAVVGLGGALAAMGFRTLLDHLVRWLSGHQTTDLVAMATQLPPWWRVLLPTCGGAIAGAILVIGGRLRARSTTDYMEAAVVGDGRMDLRRTLAKAASSLATIVSGGSIGREGSMVQLGALLASLTARILPLPASSRPLLVGCGAAAGMAAVYNAPLAGAVFVAEVVLGTMAVEVLGPLVVAAVISAAVTRLVFGGKPLYPLHSDPVGSFGELAPYAALGVVAALAAPLYLGALDGARRLFALSAGTIWKMALGGSLVGLISLGVPAVWGNGQEVITAVIGHALVPQLLLTLLIAKVVATAATTGSGAVGGVFTPTLCVGSIIGALWAYVCQHVAPQVAPSAECAALVGMGAFLAATTRAPVTAMLMIFEMTLDDGMILPLGLACMLAYYLAGVLRSTPLYHLGGKQRERTAAQPAWEHLRVGELVKPPGPVVSAQDTFAAVVRSFASNRFNFLFVLDRAGAYLGAISIHDIKEHLHDPHLGALALAQDLVVELPALQVEDGLPRALEAFARHPGNRLPVVDHERRLIGCVHKYDVMVAFAHGNLATETLPASLRDAAPGAPAPEGAQPTAR